ncbi:MAG: hypothetical protein K2X39_00680 [Silvanigrellaceae bacterium]|nr:hypothetical protein [Silvanigrellaceae bacterium]
MSVSEKSVLSLSFFDEYQSKIISITDAEKIKDKQDEIIKCSFSQGFNQINDAYQTEITPTLIQYLYKVDQGVFLNNTKDFKKEQDTLLNLIHTSNLIDTKKIYYEYLIGLSRFVISIQLLYGYVKYINKESAHDEIELYSSSLFIQDNSYSLLKYFDRLSTLSNIGKALILHLSNSYFLNDCNPENYWFDIEQYFHEHQYLDILARDLVSIQYVPENKRYLSIMQSIHWQGFGGSGNILLKHNQLNGLVVHSISHHDNYGISDSFTKRLLAFKLPLETILARTTDLICEYINRNFPIGTINIHDFCSGPRFIAVKTIIEREKKRKFHLTVSDIDGSSLMSLLKEKENNDYGNLDKYEVRYEDLCLPLNLSEDQTDKYHLVNINLGLHQLPIDEIYASIRHFSKITKVGGLIANLDASEKRYLQLMLIPGNLVDREGYVPYIEQMELAKLVISSCDENLVRIAYPLVKLSKKIFTDLDKNIGAGPYMASFYTPVVITRQEFNLLCKLWLAKKYNECDKLIQRYLD